MLDALTHRRPTTKTVRLSVVTTDFDDELPGSPSSPTRESGCAFNGPPPLRERGPSGSGVGPPSTELVNSRLSGLEPGLLRTARWFDCPPQARCQFCPTFRCSDQMRVAYRRFRPIPGSERQLKSESPFASANIGLHFSRNRTKRKPMVGQCPARFFVQFIPIDSSVFDHLIDSHWLDQKSAGRKR